MATTYKMNKNGTYNVPCMGEIFEKEMISVSDFDKTLMDAYISESDEDRSMYLHKAEDIAMNDMAIIPIFYYAGTVMQSPKLTNVMYDVFGIHNFSKAEIIKD